MSYGYVQHELNSVQPDDAGIVRVKFTGNGETRWLNLDVNAFTLVKEAILWSVQRDAEILPASKNNQGE